MYFPSGPRACGASNARGAKSPRRAYYVMAHTTRLSQKLAQSRATYNEVLMWTAPRDSYGPLLALVLRRPLRYEGLLCSSKVLELSSRSKLDETMCRAFPQIFGREACGEAPRFSDPPIRLACRATGAPYPVRSTPQSDPLDSRCDNTPLGCHAIAVTGILASFCVITARRCCEYR